MIGCTCGIETMLISFYKQANGSGCLFQQGEECVTKP